jgi:hypothetical protein
VLDVAARRPYSARHVMVLGGPSWTPPGLAHNPKVVGSNPTPATSFTKYGPGPLGWGLRRPAPSRTTAAKRCHSAEQLIDLLEGRFPPRR